ncbi:hypothetical protein BpHYR1_013469 [Brachionus plicatilis]|uniref:Uncharacterized protein n=1 Tax=Brachionus plicatilis TaxID=10195 RepID=A0A3M7P763_BRAPC|nr:hypothetical protein BpHYR1_013469 [Brachionus plicatilis]
MVYENVGLVAKLFVAYDQDKIHQMEIMEIIYGSTGKAGMLILRKKKRIDFAAALQRLLDVCT